MKIIITGLLLACIGTLLISVFPTEASEHKKEDPGNQVLRTPSSMAKAKEALITLDHSGQKRSGIMVSAPRPIVHQQELQAYGWVLDLQDLADLRRTLVNLQGAIDAATNRQAEAQAQVEKTKSNLEALSQQYERSKALYEDNRNVSARKYQEAKAAWQSAIADTQSAQAALRASQKSIKTAEDAWQALVDSARLKWGGVIAKWISDDTPALEKLFHRQTCLIQVTLPSGVEISPVPDSIRIQTLSNQTFLVRLVSPSPHMDPRIQGLSFFYLAQARMDLFPGMNVVAYVPTGAHVKGVIIPDSAVVWWQGKAWVYLQKNTSQFIRRVVSTSIPVDHAYLVAKDFTSMDRIVVQGAQILFSLEFQPKRQGAGERDMD